MSETTSTRPKGYDHEDEANRLGDNAAREAILCA